MTEAVHGNSRIAAWRAEWSRPNVSPKAFGQQLFVATGAATPW
jgi:hypothetical protein